MRNNGCYGCHKVTGVFEVGGSNGPALDQGNGLMIDRILQRISSMVYLKSLQKLDEIDGAPRNHLQDARDWVVTPRVLIRSKSG
jgi:hypothetical protein